MKKNKFFTVMIIFLSIIFVQPRSRQFLVSVFTHNDFASQIGISNSTEEKIIILSPENKKINQELVNKKFEGQQVIQVNDHAQFTPEELSLSKNSWQSFSPLDYLNRVQVANAMLGKEIMPTVQRDERLTVTPTGFRNKKIIINGKDGYLFNRCHLIGYQLTGENSNPKNLMTGTQNLNSNFEDEKSSMVYYENMVAHYIRLTNHHVRYRVSPLFKNVEMVARGIRIEAQSVEDNQISFDIYIFNVQPGYKINYLTGHSVKEN